MHNYHFNANCPRPPFVLLRICDITNKTASAVGVTFAGGTVFHLFVGEAKNLQARSHGSSINNYRDVYCTLSLDQEEIFRTSTIEKTLR